MQIIDPLSFYKTTEMNVITVSDDALKDEFILDEHVPTICCGQVSSAVMKCLRDYHISFCKIITSNDLEIAMMKSL